MKDRSATTSAARLPHVAGREVADVGALPHHDPGIGAQPLVELAVADVDGHHRRDAPRWSRQSVNPPVEAPRSRPAAVDGTSKRVERGVELLPAAPHEARTRSEHVDRLTGRDERAALSAGAPPT